MYHMVHSRGVTDKGPRATLLEGAIDYVAHNGITDLSLRQLAAALGTSHRMLIHHFGSKEGLWVAIVREVERRQRAILADLVPSPDVPVDQAMRAWWRHISDPSLWPNERLFYELYGQAIQGRPHTVKMLDGIIDDWLEPAAEINMAYGLSPPEARAHARLGIAVTRGLLLDLVATRDIEGVNAAMDAFIDVYVAWLATRNL
jgi:AcrR family transcriptional regulator